MKKTAFLSFLSLLTASTALAQTAASFTLKTSAFEGGKTIPAKYAYCVPDGKGRTIDGGNVNPDLRWSNAPAGTQSYALIVVDPDVPADFSVANIEKPIANDYPRQNFYHWVLFDIPATITFIEEGRDSQRVIPGGKPIGKTAYGITGPNDYARAYKGSYGGYDGPCPPWNDERLHHYHFIVYALDVPTLGLTGPLAGKLVEDAMKDHILAKTEIVGTYTDNPTLAK